MTNEEREIDAERLSKLTKRAVEYRAVMCGCDYWKYCPTCLGVGQYWIPVYVSCGHHLLEDNREEACYENFCQEREQVKSDPFIHSPLESLSEVESRREEMEVV